MYNYFLQQKSIINKRLKKDSQKQQNRLTLYNRKFTMNIASTKTIQKKEKL